MAEAKSGKTRRSEYMETEQAVGGGGEEAKRALIEPEVLLELLDAHAKTVAVAVGEILVDKLAGLQSWPTEGRHTEHARQAREEIEREEAWLTA